MKTCQPIRFRFAKTHQDSLHLYLKHHTYLFLARFNNNHIFTRNRWKRFKSV